MDTHLWNFYLFSLKTGKDVEESGKVDLIEGRNVVVILAEVVVVDHSIALKTSLGGLVKMLKMIHSGM